MSATDLLNFRGHYRSYVQTTTAATPTTNGRFQFPEIMKREDESTNAIFTSYSWITEIGYFIICSSLNSFNMYKLVLMYSYQFFNVKMKHFVKFLSMKTGGKKCNI